MIRNTDATEKLYLSKKVDETIFIENCKIPQHHLDGVRFLYRQYKKEKPGVIINDTTGFSRYLQVVLFVKAMCHIFKQPVLVLCQEGYEHSWIEQFQTWTDLCDDVVLELQKPYIKKQVLINTMANLSSFCNRSWSVLVVDVPDLGKATLQLLGLPFHADYKIFITPINIRENLDQFSKIYKWLYPKEVFDKNKFIPNRNNFNDVVDKAILLDAFMEDIVSRNEEVQGSVEYDEIDESPPKRISLKNKDATGTKIKRSKRRIHDDDDDSIKNAACSQNSLLEDTEYNEDFSIDNFKRKRKELKNTHSDKEESDTEIKMDTLNSQSQVNLFYEPDSSTDVNSDRLYEMDTLVFGNDTCDERSVNVNDTVNEIIEAAEDSYLRQEQNINKESKLGAEDETPSENDLDTQEKDELFISNNDIFTKPSIEIETQNNDLNKENSTDIKDGISIEFEGNGHDLKQKNNELKTRIESKIISEEIKSGNNTEPLEVDELKPNTDDNKKALSNEVQIEPNFNEVNDEKSLLKTNVDVAVSNALKHKCIEDKLKELEEKVMKRFKGSILDSLI